MTSGTIIPTVRPKNFLPQGFGSEVEKLNVMEDGHIYWLSTCTIGDYNGDVWGGFTGSMIRKDWLDRLGLEKPETTDKLFEVLCLPDGCQANRGR